MLFIVCVCLNKFKYCDIISLVFDEYFLVFKTILSFVMFNNFNGDPFQPSNPPTVNINFNLVEVIQTLTSDELINLMKTLDVGDLQRFEVEVLSTVKDKKVVRAFLDRKVEALQQKIKFDSEGVVRTLRVGEARRDISIISQISEAALQILHHELIRFILKMDQGGRDSFFQGLSPAQMKVCLQQLQIDHRPETDNIYQELAGRVRTDIDINPDEEKARFIEVIALIRQLVTRIESEEKIPLSKRKIIELPFTAFFGRIWKIISAPFSWIQRFFSSLGTADIHSYLKGRIKKALPAEVPDWTRSTQHQILGMVSVSPELNEKLQQLVAEGKKKAGITGKRTEEQIAAEQLMGMTITDTIHANVATSELVEGGPFISGGDNLRVTLLEVKILEDMLGANETPEKKAQQLRKLKSDYHIKDEEILQLESYLQNLKNSEEINCALQGIQLSLKEVKEINPEKIAASNQQIEQNLEVISQHVIQKCHGLLPGESLFSTSLIFNTA